MTFHTSALCRAQLLQVPATSGASRQTVNAIDVVQLVRKVKQGSGRQAHVNTVQQRLRQWCPAFSKVTCGWHKRCNLFNASIIQSCRQTPVREGNKLINALTLMSECCTMD